MIYHKQNKAIICDVDGVILNPERRKNRFLQEGGVYEDYIIGGEGDEIIQLGVDLLESQLREEHELFYLTGRSLHHAKSLLQFMEDGEIPKGQLIFMHLPRKKSIHQNQEYSDYFSFKSSWVSSINKMYTIDLIIEDSFEVIEAMKAGNQTIPDQVFYHFTSGIGDHKENFDKLCEKLTEANNNQ